VLNSTEIGLAVTLTRYVTACHSVSVSRQEGESLARQGWYNMPLIRIELCDFKSYRPVGSCAYSTFLNLSTNRGHQVIGPFKNFTSIIGPNGAGKSNLMDAISFVLGVRSAQLRSSQLRDLVYRGRRLARDNADGTSQPDQEDEVEDEREGEGTAKKAWVLAVFEDERKKEWLFQRTCVALSPNFCNGLIEKHRISTTGASEYKLNKRIVTYTTYNEALIKHNILVKAKNFLVFQGDVEAVASQSPKELTRLVEQISGSLELTAEYEKAKEDQDRATENATHNFTKRRAITGEIKQYKEQKGEAERFEALCQERVRRKSPATRRSNF
jgi:structural maintenance of chromosome 1